MADKKTLLIFQPVLTEYRRPVFEELSETYQVHVASSSPATGSGFVAQMNNNAFRSYLLAEWSAINGALLFQRKALALVRELSPDFVFLSANPRYISVWAVLLYCRLKGIPAYAHGQGMYSKPKPYLTQRAVYAALVALSARYIAYTPFSKTSLVRAVGHWAETKIRVAENSIENKYPVTPAEKFLQRTARDILFIGRLRKKSNVEALIHAVAQLREEHPVRLHVIGDGVEAMNLRKRFRNLDWVVWYGGVHDQDKIREISLGCVLGCYPGDAGLSLVHYMSLSIVPVVHDTISEHMGPEPSYVEDHVNGLHFSKSDLKRSLAETLRAFFELSMVQRQTLAANAFHTYENLTHPSLAKRLIAAME